MRGFNGVGIAVLIGAIMSSCTNQRTVDSRSLRIHLPVVNLNLDPHRMEDAYSMGVITQIHRGLLRYNTTGDIRADLAQSWSESPDRLTYTVKLKKATFSNGSLVTAKHVQMTFARLFRLGASMAADIDYIAGATKFKQTQNLADFGVKALSPDTVEFRLAKPSSLFLKQLAVVDCAILHLDDFRKDPDLTVAGGFSGPYRIASNLQQGKVQIAKWRKDELDSANPPEQITYFMTDSNPVKIAESGETDSLDHVVLTSEEKKHLQELGWAPAPTELAGEVFVVFNPDRVPEEARRLLYRSLDPKKLLEALGPRPFKPAYGLIPFGLAGELSRTDAESLHVPQKLYSGPKVRIELEYEAQSDLEQKIVQYLRQTWSQPGIEIVPRGLTKREKLANLFGKKSQAILARKAMDYPDGFSVLGYFKGHYESNYFYVSDPKIDRALLDVVQIFDQEERSRKYRDIQIQILRHATIVPLLFGSEASGLWSKRLKSVPSHPLGAHTLPMETVEIN